MIFIFFVGVVIAIVGGFGWKQKKSWGKPVFIVGIVIAAVMLAGNAWLLRPMSHHSTSVNMR